MGQDKTYRVAALAAIAIGALVSNVVLAGVDLAVTKTVDNPTPSPGSSIAYSVGVTNRSATNATGVQITDLLPAGVVFSGFGSSQGGYNSTNGQWAVGAVNASASASLVITATVEQTVSFDQIVLNPSILAGDFFGRSVAPIGPGLFAVGADGDDAGGANDSGIVHLFDLTGALVRSITNPTPDVSDFFGYAVSAVGDDLILVGSDGDDPGGGSSGSAYLFDTNGAMLLMLTNPTPVAAERFGFALAGLGDDRFVIGDYRDGLKGAAYVYNTNGTLLATMTNPIPGEAEDFGRSVATIGDQFILIGGPSDDQGSFIDAGRVYLYTTNGTLITAVTNPSPDFTELFGWSVAGVGADKFVVGAHLAFVGVNSYGEAYLYDTNGTLLVTITNPAPVIGDEFGYAVSGLGVDRLIIGARNAETGGAANAGAAYVFGTDGTLLARVDNPAPFLNDQWGEAVASVGNGQIAIGARLDDAGQVDSGSVTLYDVPEAGPITNTAALTAVDQTDVDSGNNSASVVINEPPGPPPDVTNDGGARRITSSSADLRGALQPAGSSPADITIYWGPTDGVMDPAAWTNSTPLGSLGVGLFSTNMTGLAASTLYYYRVFASNANGTAWAPTTTNFTTGTGGPVLYVDKDATGHNNGSSWTNAYVDLQDGLFAAVSNDQLWVAEGTYKPTTDAARGLSFHLENGVEIYGGFAGVETNLTERNWTNNLTFLSGDLAGDDIGFSNMTENAFHVVVGAPNGHLDGFWIVGGRAVAPSPVVDGGGMLNPGHMTTIRNCTFARNFARAGGAVFMGSAMAPEFVNCVFSDNRTSDEGAAVRSGSGTQPVFDGCLFAGNVAGSSGGALNTLFTSFPVIRNSAFVGNRGTSGGAVSHNGQDLRLESSVLAGNIANFNGGGVVIAGTTGSVVNCTFADNRALWGGAFRVQNSGTASLQNSVFWTNSASIAGHELHAHSATATVAYCDLVGRLDGPNVGVASDGAFINAGGNIAADPLFPPPANGLWTAEALFDATQRMSTLTDSGAAWAVNEHAGKVLQADTAVPSFYAVVSNSATALVAWGNLSTTALTSVSYEIVDYHPQSTVGRWNEGLAAFTNDSVTSPLIDRGDPVSVYTNETLPNGSRINIGAYGGTVEASLSPPLVIDNAGGATNVLNTSAFLNGALQSTSAAPTAVAIYWGPSDGGTNSAAWFTSNVFGSVGLGLFSTNITGLTPGMTYYYRSVGSNPGGSEWAPSSAMFTTLSEVDLEVNKTESKLTPFGGEAITYTVTITNRSTNVATGVEVTDILPNTVTFISAAPTSGAYDSTTGVWSVGVVAPGGSETLTLGATVHTPLGLERAINSPVPEVGGFFGSAVDNIGGDRFLAGASMEDPGAINEAGRAYIYRDDGALLATITNPFPQIGDNFGNAVAVLADPLMVIAASSDNTGASDSGRVYLYSTNGTLITPINNPTPSVMDYFGNAVASVGPDRFVVAASSDSPGGIMNAGSVHLFLTNSLPIVTITNPAPQVDDHFGSSVAGVGLGMIAVGAEQDNPGGSNDAGTVYMFDNTGTLLYAVTNPLPAPGANFGSSVAGVGPDLFVVGASGHNGGGFFNSGCVHVFSTNGTLLTTVFNPDPDNSDRFGKVVTALGPDRFLVGVEDDKPFGVNGAGSAYMYSTNGALLARLPNPQPALGDSFGSGLSMLGPNRFLVSAVADNFGTTNNAGTVYLYKLNGGPDSRGPSRHERAQQCRRCHDLRQRCRSRGDQDSGQPDPARGRANHLHHFGQQRVAECRQRHRGDRRSSGRGHLQQPCRRRLQRCNRRLDDRLPAHQYEHIAVHQRDGRRGDRRSIDHQ